MVLCPRACACICVCVCVSVYPERYSPGALSDEGRFVCLFRVSTGGAIHAGLREIKIT